MPPQEAPPEASDGLEAPGEPVRLARKKVRTAARDFRCTEGDEEGRRGRRMATTARLGRTLDGMDDGRTIVEEWPMGEGGRRHADGRRGGASKGEVTVELAKAR